MHIDKYKKDNDYVDPDNGCSWGNAEDFIQGYLLGFCCCGNATHSFSLVRDVLRHIRNLQASVWANRTSWNEWEAEGDKICGQREMYFVFYFLDAKGFTEHGGSVPGWLTEKGKELLEDLDELLSP